MDVEWVENGKAGTYDVKEGEFVVRLDPSAAQPKNIVTLAILLVRETTLRGVRSCVSEPLRCAIDMNLVRNLLYQLRNRKVFDWFMSTQYQPLVQSDQDIDYRNTQIRAIDQRGFFAHLLLVELDEFCRKVFGQVPTPAMGGEIRRLVDFLHVLAIKKRGQDVYLDIRTAHFSINIVLVAKTQKILEQGVGPYMTAIEGALQHGFQVQYVLVFDQEWRGVGGGQLARFNQRVSDLWNRIATETVLVKDFTAELEWIDQNGDRKRGTLVRYRTPA